MGGNSKGQADLLSVRPVHLLLSLTDLGVNTVIRDARER